MLNIVCVQTGNYCGRGREYVTNLRRQVQRHLSLPHEFHLFTDDPEDYPGWVVHQARFPGWWAKLQIFEPGVFDDQVMFIDLDTYIVRNFDDVAEYRGNFATLRDFWTPNRVGPAIMVFNPKWAESIYREWESQGFQMEDGLGDLAFINNLDQGRFARNVDILQELYPGKFVSYKTHAREEIPSDAAFICFHGRPRPHEAEGWAKTAWELGGLAVPKFNPVLNVPAVTMIHQAEHNLAREVDLFLEVEKHDGEALIVAGGPSLVDNLQNLRWHHERGGLIFAVNGCHDWLIERGIVPQFHVILDAREQNAAFVQKPHPDVTYLIAAQCHPGVFDALAGHRVIAWLAHMDGAIALANRIKKPLTLVGGGNTVGLKAMTIAQLWGFRRMRLYGFDSCYRGDANHAYKQSLNDGEETMEVVCAGRKFRCAKWMIRQAAVFDAQSQEMAKAGVTISVTGDGLIPWMVRKEAEAA